MRSRNYGLWAFAAITALFTGCVDRRFVVTTNVPGAQVAVDGRDLGPSPADGRFDYAGYYEFRANAPGYESLIQKEKLRAKWYDYPGLDFIAEVVWPFRIEDVRHVHLDLQPAKPFKNEELVSRADELRGRSATLPPPRIPNDSQVAQPPGSDFPGTNPVPVVNPPRPLLLPYSYGDR